MLWVSDTLPKSFNLHNTHQESNRQTLFLYSEKQNNWQTILGQKFRRGQKLCWIPELSLKFRTRAGALAIWEVAPAPDPFLDTNGFAK